MSDYFKEQLEKIQECQATIDKLLNFRLITDKDDNTRIGRWFIKELYHQEGECNIGFAESGIEGRVEFPLHKHPTSKEYIICVKGAVLVNINGAERILNEGDCASIDEGVIHYSKPVRSPSKLVYVCIPNDKNFQG